MGSIVCLHGLGRTPADWDGVRSGLQAYGAVRVPSLSSRPSEATVEIDSAVGTGDLVIGHSMGGVLALRILGQRPRPVRGIILTNCFFPPARNGRSFAESLRDYLAHRLAFVRSFRERRKAGDQPGGSLRGLAYLVRLASRPGRFDAEIALSTAQVLVVHSRDDHYVPADFALATVARHPHWDIRLLEEGGHNAHVYRQAQWLAAVTSWLEETKPL